MDNAIFSFPKPINEPVKAYAPGSSEKASLKKALAQLSSEEWDIPLVIGGKEIRTGNTGKVVMPHDHHHVLATYHKAGEKEVQMAIDAAMKAHKEWSELPWVERASVMLRVAELLSTKYRYILNASVMLGQSKNPFQAEIDAPCELIDFLRFSTFYASQVYADQPYSETGILNRMEYRALEGFVFSLTPFNFTSIASNLNMAPAMMGNVAVWKPSTTAIHSNYFLMKVFQEAGLPDGVVNFIPGQGSVIGKVVTASRDLGGFHFTGSTSTFNTLWRQIGENLGHYKSYPKIVGETGGKNFIFVHPSAPALDVATAIVRGAFEYQGQKCSAGSRAYIPASLWKEVKEYVGDMLKEIKMGDVQDFTNFINAVIDEASFDNIMSYIDYAKQSPDAEIVFGGNGDKSVGYFVEPTVIQTTDPMFKSMVEEIFGPADQVRQNISYFCIRHIFGYVIAFMGQIERDIVTHPQQLSEEDTGIIALQAFFIYQFGQFIITLLIMRPHKHFETIKMIHCEADSLVKVLVRCLLILTDRIGISQSSSPGTLSFHISATYEFHTSNISFLFRIIQNAA